MARGYHRPQNPLLANVVDPKVSLTNDEEVIAVLIGLGASDTFIMQELHLPNRQAAKDRIRVLGKKIPGDMPRKARIMAWARGGSMETLTGDELRIKVMLNTEQWRSTNAGRKIVAMANAAPEEPPRV